MRTSDTPLASILLLTYNHAAYVEQALEGCLSQKTSFPFEIIAGDDASPDGTGDILRKWAARHPQIVLSIQPRNSGGGKNYLDAMRLIRGRYVAFCEGDDFWTVPYKLEKQVRFLEESPDFSVCCHRVEMVFGKERDAPENRRYVYKDCESHDPRIQAGEFFADEAIANYYFQTGSVCFRWRFRDGFPHWFEKRMLFDHYLFMLHAVEGKIKYFDEPMSCWRRHESGYSWLQEVDKGIFFQKEIAEWLPIYAHMDKFFSKRFTWQIRERILLALREVAKNCLAVGQIEHLRRLLTNQYLQPLRESAVLLDAMRLLFPEEKKLFPPWTSPDAVTGTPTVPSPLTPAARTDGAAGEAPSLPEGGFPYPQGETMLPHFSVGDVFELDLEAIPPSGESVWQQWIQGGEYACFANLRAALSAYLWNHAITALWLPSFLPPILHAMCVNTQIKRKIYHMRKDLSCSTDFLNLAMPGEAVLTICYFGRPTPGNLERALLNRPDLHWIEDRAQALWPGKAKAHATLYSPRKVLGVPDGGILIGQGAAACAPAACPKAISTDQTERIREATTTILDRYERRGISGSERLKHTVHTNYTHALPPGGPSRLTLAMLKRIPMKQMASARKKNWETLHGLLAKYALWPVANPSFVPSGFPLVMPTSTLAMMAHSLLAAKGYACSRDWTETPVSGRGAMGAQTLAATIFVIPCDHRYGEEEMRAMAGEVLNIIAGNISHAPRKTD